MPKVGIRAVAASASHVGRQGMLKCACTGTIHDKPVARVARQRGYATLAATRVTPARIWKSLMSSLEYGRVRRDAKRWHLCCGCICLTRWRT
eukprot:3127404-Pleurochrysis_carterae.AAC.1